MADVVAANAAQGPRAAARPKPRLLLPSIMKVVEKKPEPATAKNKRFVLELDDGDEVQFDTVEEVLAFVAIYQQKRG